MAGAIPPATRRQFFHRLPPLTTLRRPPSSHGATIVAMVSGSSYWTSIQADIHAHLHQAIPATPPAVVIDPMRHLVLAAPNPAAPALCVAACELLGGRREDALRAASALHLAHAASAAHVLLLATERPTGRPAYAPNIQLLTGDGMGALAFELLARPGDPAGVNPDRILRVIVEIARAVGGAGAIGGRYQELRAAEEGGAGWAERVGKKEGVLCGCAAACGAIVGGGTEVEIEKLREYGVLVGRLRGLSERDGERVEWVKEMAIAQLAGFGEGQAATLTRLVEVMARLVYV